MGVFNERDADARAAAIAATYTEDVQWSDDEGVTVGRDALAAKAQAVLAGIPGLVFSKIGEVQQTRGMGYLGWRLGPDGGEAVATGFDVAIITDDRIAALYTVVNPAPK
jgi:hypothetical protein